MNWNKIASVFMVYFLLFAVSCKNKEAVNPEITGQGAAKFEPREMPKTLPEPSAEELEKKERAVQLLQELHDYLSAKPEFSEFAVWVGQLKDKNILSNQDRQNYRILALNNQAMKNFPQREHDLLVDDSGRNQGYQMKVLLHHICPEPFNPYNGYEYRSLAGIPLTFGRDSLKVPAVMPSATYKSLDKIGNKLFVYSLSKPLYY